MPLSELPGGLGDFVRTRALVNINNALRADGQQPLDEAALRISPDAAAILKERYTAAWDPMDVYDRMLEERVDALLANGGAGTDVLDVSAWDAVTPSRIFDGISQALGRDIKAAQRQDPRTIVRWRREGANHVRYGVFAPGTDAILDRAWLDCDRELTTTVRMSLIQLAGLFERR